MNKKFTMVCASLLLTSAFTVNAAEPQFDSNHKAVAQAGAAVQKLNEGQNSGLYQISTVINDETYVLSMDEQGKIKAVPNNFTATRDADALAKTLWCVTVSSENQGQAPKYDFMNKGTGLYLDMTMAGLEDLADGVESEPIEVGGEIGGWAFSKTFKEALEQNKGMFSYYTNDKVVGLALDDEGYLVAVKASAVGAEDNTDFQPFTLRTADQIILTADELNTILGSQKTDAGLQLKFNPDIKGTTLTNPFNNAKFIAEASEDADYLYVSDLKKESYLKVDTAYTNESGVKFLAYGWTKADKEAGTTAKEEVANSVINDQHKFKFIYAPTEDKLYVYVQDVTKKADNVKYWTNVASENAKAEAGDAEAQSGDWRVSLQDLIKDQVRILTVDYDKQNTTINLGFGGCAATSITKTSVADDVYYIQNAKGQYLASVIYENGEVAPKFVTVNAEEQDVAHMPAYQWVVLKKYTQNEDVKATSPVTITNREFADETYQKAIDVQLFKNEGATKMYVKTFAFGDAIVDTDSLTFTAVPASSKSDANLGYKKLTKEELMVNKYTFNYWHPYATDKFIAQSANDSTLTVMNGKDAFVIDTIPAINKVKNTTVDIEYGFDVTKDVAKRIPGLKQLVRTAYEVSLDGNTIAVNKANQFNVGVTGVAGSESTAVPYVFFKENNHIDGNHYYAIVEAEISNGELTIGDKEYTIKAGVSDYDADATLKSQLLNETRTSAFAIAPDNTPLYRRFDSAVLEGNEGDAADTLRFVEQYRGEYLQMEANENFMKEGIKFLGIDDADKSEVGLAFIVDTAWVNRGAGNIKPQYLISIDRNDFEGVPGEPCTESGPHFDHNGNVTDAAHCVHAHMAVPGFQRGWYLINFHDIASDYSVKDAEANYKWNEYDRAGFMEGIRVADTLYILRDEFKGLANDKIDFDALNKAEEDAKAAAEKAGKTYVSYKYVLSGDNHKYVTWSMRFVDPEKAANEVEEDRAFLFESMNASENRDASKFIAPTKAAWLKMQNGCLVLSDKATSEFENAKTGGDDALIFNVAHVENDEIATENESINATEVSVIATDGGVYIKNAAGKNVVVTTILGQIVANEVLTSDNATIAVPAGIAIVSVDGEEAVKVSVK